MYYILMREIVIFLSHILERIYLKQSVKQFYANHVQTSNICELSILVVDFLFIFKITIIYFLYVYKKNLKKKENETQRIIKGFYILQNFLFVLNLNSQR